MLEVVRAVDSYATVTRFSRVFRKPRKVDRRRVGSCLEPGVEGAPFREAVELPDPQSETRGSDERAEYNKPDVACFHSVNQKKESCSPRVAGSTGRWPSRYCTSRAVAGLCPLNVFATYAYTSETVEGISAIASIQ